MGLSSLGRLVTLYLEENRIQELLDFSLRNLSSLEELYLNHNHITSIAPDAFAGLNNLLRYPVLLQLVLTSVILDQVFFFLHVSPSSFCPVLLAFFFFAAIMFYFSLCYISYSFYSVFFFTFLLGSIGST